MSPVTVSPREMVPMQLAVAPVVSTPTAARYVPHTLAEVGSKLAVGNEVGMGVGTGDEVGAGDGNGDDVGTRVSVGEVVGASVHVPEPLRLRLYAP